MRAVEQIMGMPITIDIPNCEDKAVFDKAFSRLREIDSRFSIYKKNSEVSKFANGRLKESELSDELTEVIAACRKAEEKTNGYFSAWYNDRFNPSGYVKGWAIAEAGKVIEQAGYKTYCIGAGGDILARSDSNKKWNIGIQDPTDKTKILNKLSISNGAVATSGSYERGSHIINPKTKQPADAFLSVSVSGQDMITADVLATAIFAAGQKSPRFLKNFPAYGTRVIDKNKVK